MPSKKSHPSRARDTLIVRALRRGLAGLASLRMAIGLLSLFTLCLVAATWLESTYTAHIAQQLVYGTWWFVGLLLLLAVNVLGAALKKYPWKRHQIGFLVTHAGLLVLLIGGLLTAVGGVEGQMLLVDTSDAELQARLGIGNKSDLIYLEGQQQIEVFRLCWGEEPDAEGLLRVVRAIDRGEEVPEPLRHLVDRTHRVDFSPAPLAWASENPAKRPDAGVLDLLAFLADPVPGFTRHLDGQTTLTVTHFYPSTEPDPQAPEEFVPRWVHPGSMQAERLSPGLRGRLTVGNRAEDFAVALHRPAARVRLGSDLYLIRYRPAARRMDFTLTLHKARQLTDAGSDRPAAFESEVTLTAQDEGVARERSHRVSMNNTLDHGFYKVYQTNYRLLIDPRTDEPLLEDDRPVSLSGLTVAHDPGLWSKYVGSFLVVLGIGLMFSMKAYFFRSQKPGRVAANEPSETVSATMP